MWSKSWELFLTKRQPRLILELPFNCFPSTFTHCLTKCWSHSLLSPFNFARLHYLCLCKLDAGEHKATRNIETFYLHNKLQVFLNFLNLRIAIRILISFLLSSFGLSKHHKFERDFSTWCWVSIWWMATVMRWIETIIKPFDGWKKHSNISRSTAMKVRRKQIKYWDNPIFLLPASFFDWYKPKRSTVNQQPVPFVFTCHYLRSFPFNFPITL